MVDSVGHRVGRNGAGGWARENIKGWVSLKNVDALAGLCHDSYFFSKTFLEDY
jgi:hypothetical protein